MDLFTSQGYHASTTPQIAARAGIAEGTIYRHFHSKAHLLNEMYRAGLRMLTDIMQRVPGRLGCHERLHRIASEWQNLASKNPQLAKFIFATDFAGLLDSGSTDAERRFRVELEKVIADGKAAGVVRAGSVELWTDVWLRLVTLVLERTASGDWPLDHPAAGHVIEGAWEAIRAPVT